MEDVVSRYANAIVEIAKEENKLMQYKIAVFEISSKLYSETKLLKLFSSYFIKNDIKFEVVDELCSSYKLVNFTNFMKLLIVKHKILKFKDIAKEINKEINNELDIFEGIIYSTIALNETKINEIESAISNKLHRKVELTNKIDKRLIGGVKVVVHDHVFDGSIKNKLENMKQDLKERRND